MTVYSLHPLLVKNSGLGAVELSEDDLAKLVDGLVDTNPVTISGTVGLEVDFFSRVRISEIRYYYSQDSTITIQYSPEGDSWFDFSPVVHDGYTSVSGELVGISQWPSKLRILHTPTGLTADVYEIEVTNDDTQIVVPQTGVEVDSGTEGEITDVRVYNNTQETKDTHFFIDVDDGSTYDDCLRLSDSPTGVFSPMFTKGIGFPSHFGWAIGLLSGTVVSGTSLVLDPASGTGYFTSPVFDISTMGPSRVFWQYTTSPNSYIDYSSSVDSSSTVGIRLSETAPVGIWSSGDMPNGSDPVWGTEGSLQYNATPNYSILKGPPGRGRYCQLVVEMSTTVSGESVALNTLGLEEATTISGVLPNSYGVVYVSTSFDSYVAGQSANILSFFQE